jgi:hypothetical protein
MIDYLESVIDRHRAGGVLIDSNLLLLLLAGLHDRPLVSRLKRLNTYTQEDFDLLFRFCGFFAHRVTTPHVLTEVSNLSEKGAQSVLRPFFEFMAEYFVELDEQYENSAILAKHTLFVSFGLADSALAQASDDGLLILTDDLRLYAALERRGAPAINFNHLRMGLL